MSQNKIMAPNLPKENPDSFFVSLLSFVEIWKYKDSLYALTRLLYHERRVLEKRSAKIFFIYSRYGNREPRLMRESLKWSLQSFGSLDLSF